MLKTEGLGKKKICIHEKYKNTVMPHGHHIYAKASGMEKAKMCAYPQSNHAFTKLEMCHEMLCQMSRR